MRRSALSVAAASLLLVGLGAGSAAGAIAPVPASGPSARPASSALRVSAGVARPGTLRTLRATHTTDGPTWKRAAALRAAPHLQASAVATADIRVNYSAGFSPAAETAFQAAVDIWKTQINSTVPITIDAVWGPLDPGVLGQAGPANFRRDFPGAPLPGTYYPDALANTLAGRDLDTAHSEISANFNSTFPSWYLGTDGHPGTSSYDFESVVLHELGHGLGFVGTFDGLTPPNWTDTGRGYWGLDSPGDAPTVFDRLLVDGSGRDGLNTSVYAQGSLGLGAWLRGANGGVQWKGGAGIAAAGSRPLLYSPSSFEPGSSVSHLSEDAYPAGTVNALMTPYMQNGEAVHDPGPIVRGMFADMGWPVPLPAADSAIATLHTDMGGDTGVLGPAVSAVVATQTAGGRYQQFRSGAIYWSPATGAHELHGRIYARWLATGGETGALRFPTTNEQATSDFRGRLNEFQGGSIYWSPATDAFEVHGAIRTKWLDLQSVLGLMKYPISDERGSGDAVGRYNVFQGGTIYWSPASGAHEVHGLIRSKWAALGAERGRLGYPVSDEFAVPGGRRSTFQRGSITYVFATGALLVS